MRKRMVGMFLLLLCMASCAHAATLRFDFPVDDGELVNPFIGNAGWASNDSEREQPFTLVYANLTWAELEPEEGVYDFAGFEERMHFDLWREQGKRLILRFVMDVPGSKKHADIPDWLRKETQGAYYSVSYGRGYCPDYANERLLEAHARVLHALGERYDDDPFVAYVQLGSLGHWGEWHVHDKAGSMPDEDVRNAYMRHYTEAFSDTLLMMRRPFAYGVRQGMGLYNDTAGAPSSTATWLGWIAEGGDYEGEEDALLPCPDAWQTAPIGGELATSMEPEDMLENLEETMTLFERSHTSWIGPGSFVNVERGGVHQQALDALMRRIGYRLRVTHVTADVTDEHVSLSLAFTNDGTAPFYHGWQACVRLTDTDGETWIQPLENIVLKSLLPGQVQEATLALPRDVCDVHVGIVDPQTGDAGVELAMQAEREGCWYRVMRITSAQGE